MSEEFLEEIWQKIDDFLNYNKPPKKRHNIKI